MQTFRKCWLLIIIIIIIIIIKIMSNYNYENNIMYNNYTIGIVIITIT